MTKPLTKLPPRRVAFCKHYIASLQAGRPNAAAAARAAGFSPKGAKQAAAKLLRHPDVQARLREMGRPLSVTAELAATTAVTTATQTMEALARGDPVTPTQAPAARA